MQNAAPPGIATQPPRNQSRRPPQHLQRHTVSTYVKVAVGDSRDTPAACSVFEATKKLPVDDLKETTGKLIDEPSLTNVVANHARFIDQNLRAVRRKEAGLRECLHLLDERIQQRDRLLAASSLVLTDRCRQLRLKPGNLTRIQPVVGSDERHGAGQRVDCLDY